MTHPALSALSEVLEAKDREIAELRDALGWYAQTSNWRREVRPVGGKRVQWVKSPAAFDRGARAKFVLLALGNRENNTK